LETFGDKFRQGELGEFGESIPSSFSKTNSDIYFSILKKVFYITMFDAISQCISVFGWLNAWFFHLSVDRFEILDEFTSGKIIFKKKNNPIW